VNRFLIGAQLQFSRRKTVLRHRCVVRSRKADRVTLAAHARVPAAFNADRRAPATAQASGSPAWKRDFAHIKKRVEMRSLSALGSTQEIRHANSVHAWRI